jgi:hypothetical protein
VRLTVPWDQVEPAQGQLDWSAWDAIFAALARRPAVQPLIVLDRSPTWARAANDAAVPHAPPHERADFGAFARALAVRYGPQVRYYQVWHEPNIAPHWGTRPVDPQGYLGLLREGAIQIRAADPDAVIVLAGLAPTTEAGGANLSDLAYLDALYRLGGRAWFDVVAGQPFGFSTGPEARPEPKQLNFGRGALLRAVMERYGDVGTPIWATAFGWNALPTAWNGPDSAWGQVTEQLQAQYLTEASELAATRWPWLGPLFWAANCPPLAADDPWRGFALCDDTERPRAAWLALSTAARRPVFLAAGDHATDHPALQYSQGWRVTGTGADPSADGDALTFSFYGSSLALRVQGGPYWAYYRITVDGQPANTLPRDATGAAYLALHDPLAERRLRRVASGLPLGLHTARLEAAAGANGRCKG